MKNIGQCLIIIAGLVFLFFAGVFTGYYYGGDSKSVSDRSRGIVLEDSIPADADTIGRKLQEIRYLSVTDLGIDSIEIICSDFLQLDVENFKLTASKSIAKKTNPLNDSVETISISPRHRDLLLQSIDSLFISKTSKLYNKKIKIDLFSSAEPGSIKVVIYKDGEKIVNDMEWTATIDNGYGYVYSLPYYNFLITRHNIVYHENNPIAIDKSLPEKELKDYIEELYFPDSIPEEILRQLKPL